MAYLYGSAPLPPPSQRIPLLRWLRENLFRTWYNAALTLGALLIVCSGLYGLLSWALRARWEVIPANLKTMLVGTYPVGQLWRVWSTVYLVAILCGFSSGLHRALIRQAAGALVIASLVLALLPFDGLTRAWIAGITLAVGLGFALGKATPVRWGVRLEWVGWLLSFPLTLLVLSGGVFFLPAVTGNDKWGFVLNLLGAAVGIVLSLPIGVLLALGRRSHLPAIRWVCTAYIELIRGVPLITLLFMASIMLQLLLPDSFRPDLVLRATITITAFSAAYMAENVRGGLQSIAKGQYDAAYAVGLNGLLTTVLIVLPQALRAVIPAIVGQFISLFKDTTLFGFIAVLEVLKAARSVYEGNLQWRGTIFEVYVFIALLFWVFCYSMSYVSRRIEKNLGVGER